MRLRYSRLYLIFSVLLLSYYFDQTKLKQIGLYNYLNTVILSNFHFTIMLNSIFCFFFFIYRSCVKLYPINSSQHVKVFSFIKLEATMLLFYLINWETTPYFLNKKELLCEVFIWIVGIFTKNFCLRIFFYYKNELEVGERKPKTHYLFIVLLILFFYLQKLLTKLSYFQDFTSFFFYVCISHCYTQNALSLMLCFRSTNIFKASVYTKLIFKTILKILMPLSHIWLFIMYMGIVGNMRSPFLERILFFWLIGEIRALIDAFSYFTLTRKLLKATKINFNQNKKDDQSCLICLDTIDQAILLKCGHFFHIECFENLITNNQNKKCPYCGEVTDFAMPEDEKNFVKEIHKSLDYGYKDSQLVDRMLDYMMKT